MKGNDGGLRQKRGKNGGRDETVGGLVFGTAGIRNVRRARYLLASFLDSTTREFHDIVARVY